MTLEGCDISSHQSTTPDLSAYSFVFCRATYGSSVDTMYAKHSAAVRAQGAALGAYAFGRSASRAPIADQVSVFLATAGKADLLALDLEADGAFVGMTNAEAAAFIEAVHATGRGIGLYHSLSGFPSVGQDWNWVASWGRLAPPIPWTFWQFRGSPLDLDAFNGDAAALEALIAEDAPMRTFTITGQSGMVTVTGTGHAVIPIDGSLRIPIPDGTQLGIGLPIHLDKPYDTNPGDRQSSWLTFYQGKDVALLQTDGVIALTPLPVTISVPGYLAGTVTLK